MTAKKTTIAPTEADLEAEIHRAIAIAFPWIPAGAIRHQTKFSFKFGRKTIEIDGKEISHAEARSDIILFHEERALAVLELKRNGVELSPEDEAQGLSYARVLVPSPPLVVVTNGSNIRFIESHSGKPWAPDQKSEQTFMALVTSAAIVATADLRSAIDTLMGTNPAVWMQAVRRVSEDSIKDLTASVAEPALPFAENFLLPRRAIEQVLRLTIEGKKLILLKGPPLSGKSNILRGFTVVTAEHKTVAALFMEGGVGRGILQTLADTLSRSLNWAISPDDARSWLLRTSANTDRKLVLIVDGLGSDDEVTRREIEDLTSPLFGAGLTLVVALVDGVAEKLCASSNRLAASTIGRRAVQVSVGALDYDEFEIVRRALMQNNIGFISGADFAQEYRQPWVLRAAVAPVLDAALNASPDCAVALPPLLGIDLIGHVRGRFSDSELRRLYRLLAKAVLTEAQDQSREQSLILESVAINVLRRETLKQYIDAAELAHLIDQGFLNATIHISGAPILTIRLPELLASELSRLLADEVGIRTKADPKGAAAWLVGAASNLPIGDVIAAQAIYDAARRPGSISFGFITALLEMPPQRTDITPGTRFAMRIPNVGMIELELREDGTTSVDIDGELHIIDVEDGGFGAAYHNVYPWLILSHLAALPFEMEISGTRERIDPGILLEIGSSDVVLRRPSGTSGLDAVPTHDVVGVGSIVCHQAGIVEPITNSIFRYLARERSKADAWIDVVLQMESSPLLGRVHISLVQLSHSPDENLAMWAAVTLKEKILPAFKLLSQLHDLRRSPATSGV